MKIGNEPVQRKQKSSLTMGPSTQLKATGVEATGLVAFAEKALGWMLEDKQRELLSGPSKRVILNCTRQWGKSAKGPAAHKLVWNSRSSKGRWSSVLRELLGRWMAAVALLFHAIHQPESLSIVAGPTLRQSAELLKKLKDLAWRMGINRSFAVQRDFGLRTPESYL